MLLLLLSDVLMVTAVRIRRSEGSLPSGATSSRHTLVFGRSVPDLDHDAAMRIGGEAPGDGPNLYLGFERHAPSRGHHHLGSVIDGSSRMRRTAKLCSPPGRSLHAAERRAMPSGASPVETKRHSATSSLRARATIMVLRVPPRASAVR